MMNESSNSRGRCVNLPERNTYWNGPIFFIVYLLCLFILSLERRIIVGCLMFVIKL